FLLRDQVAGRTSRSFRGTQAVSWALNNSGRMLTYSAPNGRIETIANDRMDVWVGRERVFDDILVTTPPGRITDLKWFWGQGSGVTRFEHFEIRSLEEGAPSVAVAPSGSAVVAEAEAPSPTESIALDRPTPNPFSGSMRFAYMVPGRSTAVDIGIFDLAGR